MVESQFKTSYIAEFKRLRADYPKRWIAAHWGVTPGCLQHWANQHKAFRVAYWDGNPPPSKQRISLNIEEGLYVQLHRYQVEKNVTLSETVRRALTKLLGNDGD